ncbi:MAG: squalene synthase HpnC [Isosphaera sp.]|nr:squalene synthase HpnC [Isosphaera sp.]
MGWDFARELAAWGPGGSLSGGREPPERPAAQGAHAPRSVSLARARAYCRHVTTAHYENFTVVSALLPRRLVRHFHAVYAWCRWSDDLADETAGGAEALALLDWWRGELLSCYRGEPRHPVTVALRETIRRFAIPADPFLDLLTAFTQDQVVKRYATFDQLLGYCRNSANPVGRLVLYLFGCCDAERAGLSDEVCTGLQLANFWQDVARDFALGRVYLPGEDLACFGVTEADLAAGRFTPRFRDLMRFEVDRARGFFDRGEALLPLLPREARVDVELFVRGGRAVLSAVERAGYDVLSRRPVVTKWEKAKLLAGAVARRLW